MRTLLTLLVAGLLACGVVGYANAQEGAKFGMGVELQNPTGMSISNAMVGYMFDGGEMSMSSGGAMLTPSILFTIQATPALFIEPSIGFHRMSYSEEYTGTGGGKEEISTRDLSFGIGMIYALKPDAVVSPMVHPVFNMHMVKATWEESNGDTFEAEVSTTAFSVGLGIGGLVNLKETLFLTAEARLMFTKVGDFDVSVSPAGEFTDEYDTSMSMFDTDMVIGIRFVF